MTDHTHHDKHKICPAKNVATERALVIIHDPARFEGDIVAVSGVNLPRMAQEAALLYVLRLNAHILATVPPERMPYVCVAFYSDDPEQTNQNFTW